MDLMDDAMEELAITGELTGCISHQETKESLQELKESHRIKNHPWNQK